MAFPKTAEEVVQIISKYPEVFCLNCHTALTADDIIYENGDDQHGTCSCCEISLWSSGGEFDPTEFCRGWLKIQENMNS